MWPDRRVLELFGIDVPIVQAPMAGAGGSALAIGAIQGGALGSLPCAMVDADKARAEIGVIRQQVSGPINMNFFCHAPAEPSEEEVNDWQEELRPYYEELGLDPTETAPAPNRAPFDNTMCALVEDLKPEVVSFHFGLPAADLLARVKSAGCLVISSATTAGEAVWLTEQGCDVIIAQGYEAGGHRGMFQTDLVSTQAGTLALVPQVVDAVSVPVIAAGGIADGRGIAAAFALGAAGVQIGTAYLSTPESLISELHRKALKEAHDDSTALTNIFSGRPARGIMVRAMREMGPLSDKAPPFPTAGGALAPLKAKAEANGDTSFTSLWSGQAVGLSREAPAAELTRRLAEDALAIFAGLSS